MLPSLTISSHFRSRYLHNVFLLLRSMGILLPPVPQVSTAATNNHLTLHHRNRSLDSALQRIPEVDATPSPECETTTNAILAAEVRPCRVGDSTVTGMSKAQRDELASLGSDDSGIICGSDSGSSTDVNTTRESSVEHLANGNGQSQESLDAVDAPAEDVLAVHGQCVSNSADESAGRTDVEKLDAVPKQQHQQTFGLLRLLESKVFDVSLAMHYLFKSKEPGVQSYIANRMFGFEDADVDFYLPQLVCMYIQMHDLAEVIHPYFVHR